MSDTATEFLKAETVNLSELGGTGLEHSGGRIHEEFLRQLSGTLAGKIYREMSSNDAVIGAALYAIETLIKGADISVEPGVPGDRESERAAEFLGTVHDDMSHTWSSFVGEWMATPVHGHGPFEIVYKRRDGDQRKPGESSRYTDGMIGVRKLAIRHPDSLDRWVFDDEGGVQGMVQRTATQGFKTVEIPIEKLVLFTVGQRKGSPEGTSLLRRAFTAWYRKKRVEEVEHIGIERGLAGLPVFYVPAHWMNADAGSADKASFDEIKKIGRRIRSDDQACIVLPSMFDKEGHKLVTFELAGTSGQQRGIDSGKTKEYYSRQAAMTMLADVILIGHEKVGSHALASSKTTLFAAGIGALLGDMVDTLNRHLVPRLMRLNGLPTDARMPQFRHGDIESIDLAELGEWINKLSGAGMAIFPTEDGKLERELMRLANLPSDGLPVGMVPVATEKPEDDEKEEEEENTA
jgi:hypothetical protein